MSEGKKKKGKQPQQDDAETLRRDLEMMTLRAQSANAQLQAQQATQQLQASQQQQQNMMNMNMNMMGPGMMGPGMMWPGMMGPGMMGQGMMGQGMMGPGMMYTNPMVPTAMGVNPMFTAGASLGTGAGMGIPPGMSSMGLMGQQQTAGGQNLEKVKKGGKAPKGLPPGAEWDAARNGWWFPKQSVGNEESSSSSSSPTASVVSTVEDEKEQDQEAVFKGLMEGFKKPQTKTENKKVPPPPRSDVATSSTARPGHGNAGTRSQLSHQSFGGIPSLVVQVKTLMPGLDPKPQYTAEYRAAVQNLKGRRHLTRLRTDDDLRGYLEVCYAGFEYLNMEHGLVSFPGNKANNETLKSWNEEHGNHVVCTRCAVMAVPCTHTVPCGPCKTEGVACHFSQCHLSPCNHGSHCRDAHEVFYDIMKTMYKVGKAEVNEKHLWRFPSGFENLRAALGRDGRVPKTAISPPALKLMAMFRQTELWAPKWMWDLWDPKMNASVLVRVKACENGNSKEAFDAFIQAKMGVTVNVPASASASGPLQSADPAAAKEAVVQQVELRKVPFPHNKKWGTVELFKKNNFSQYRVALNRQKDQDEEQREAIRDQSHPANAWQKMRLDAVNQESAEAFLESNKTAEQRDAEYVQRQLKRGIIIGKDGSIRRASDARLEDREQETDPANTDLEATDLAPSKEGDES